MSFSLREDVRNGRIMDFSHFLFSESHETRRTESQGISSSRSSRRESWLLGLKGWMMLDVGVSINRGTPKWMVYIGKSHLEMDDEQGYPYFRKPPYNTICIYIYIVYLKK